jgi:CubicO group peptidase (beta-lactamase class C family)
MAVVHRGSVVYTNVAGWADLERRIRATPETRFDWASIAKQFTAYGISLLVHQGAVGVNDDLRRYLPELDLAGARVTIEQLVHHTAGLEDGDGLLVLAGWRPGEPVHHRDMVRVLLRQQHLRFVPGTDHAYSNGGYSLLVEVIERVTGRDFLSFADSAIFRPLGMSSSQFVDGPRSLVPRRAMPYWSDAAGRMALSTTDLYPGAGGLFATVGDLSRWMTHLIAPRRDVVATLRLREVGRLRSGDSIGYAWGLGRMVDRGQVAYLHSGSGPASAAQLIIIPALGFGVVVATAGEVPLDPAAVARDAIDTFLGNQLGPRPTPAGRRMVMITEAMAREQPAVSKGKRATSAEIRRMVGLYRMPDSTVLGVRAGATGLEFGYRGQPPWMPLHPLGEGRFVRVPWWDVLSPVGSDSAAVALRIERTSRSIDQRADSIRIAPRLPTPVMPETELRRYEGVYYSEELGAHYEVRSGKDGLTLFHPRHGTMALTPLDELRFNVDGDGIVGVRFVPGGDRMAGLELEARSWGVTAGFRRLDW